MRRFTRLTNGFSKKLENHGHAVALYFLHYNFCRVHKTLRVTPRAKVGLVSICSDLRMAHDPFRAIQHEVICPSRRASAYQVGNAELRICIDGRPGPNAAFCSTVTFFAFAPQNAQI